MVAVSPTGSHVAYISADTRGLRATVRTLPDLQLVLQGPVMAGCDCDVDMNHARWVSRDSFEVAIPDTHGWGVFAGSAAAPRGTLHIEPTEPAWHVAR
ncbi:MAG: hypothetical protein NVS4B3_24060 [Gemmatimonadaceae bacterium]